MEKIVHMVEVPAKHIPPFRYSLAKQAGINQIMMTTWGGLGDQVCAEPTLRHAFNLFPGYKISLLTSFPELFAHLPFKQIFNNKDAASLNDDEWLVIHTYHPAANMSADFLTHQYMHCVDFSSLCAFQRQLPIKERHIQLPFSEVDRVLDRHQATIIIHPGKTWPSRTLPKVWWDEVLKRLCDNFAGVVIIGQDVSESIGTVDVAVPENCTDLRNKLSISQMAFLLMDAKVVITNDSAPLHIASAGDAHILFLSTCRDPDFLTHWRYGQFGWRMKNLSIDGLWNHQESCPVRDEALDMSPMSPSLMEKCLPNPRVILDQTRKAIFS